MTIYTVCLPFYVNSTRRRKFSEYILKVLLYFNERVREFEYVPDALKRRFNQEVLFVLGSSVSKKERQTSRCALPLSGKET